MNPEQDPSPTLSLRASALAYFSCAAVFAFFVGRGVAVSLRFEDALIVLRYARNLLGGEGFVFNPGERVLGVTTPLHTLWSTIFVALGGADAPALQNLNGLVFLVLEGFLVLLIVRRLGHPWLAFAAAALTLGNYHLNYLYFGMEVHLFTCLVLLAFLLYLDDRETPAGIVLGVAFLTRYDAALMAGLIGVALLVERLLAARRHALWRAVPWRLSAAFFAVALPWLIFAQLYFGSILPNALGAKEGYLGGVDYLTRVFFHYKETFANVAGLYTDFTNVERARGALSYLYPLAVLLGGAAAVRRDRRFLVLALYPFLHLLAYAAIGSDPGFTWHYHVVNPFFFALAPVGLGVVGLGLAGALGGRGAALAPGRRRALAALLLAAVLLPLLGHLGRQMAQPYRMDPHTRQLFPLAEWMKARHGPETSLLQPSIGILGWVTGFRMVDHAGLVTPGLYFFHDLDATPIGEVIAAHDPDLVLLSQWSPAHAEVAALGYDRVHVFEQPYTYTLFRRSPAPSPP